ncbi:hypothetical protein [Propionivibrio sp.]|uniref:hypothetical protein n=1 Tax=Propionivibrio sp. TaxID=2212460 RepID=UPI00260C1E7E|nr:hypothetical protein [Propionivibrio sp.]
MTPRYTHRLDYYTGSRWFQGALVLALIGVLASGLLSALSDARERAERQWVDLLIRHMRTGMQLAMGMAIMQQRGGEMASWVDSNPVRWLDSLPQGYRGECSIDESGALSAGEWCFERDRRELVYRPQHSDHLHMLPEGGACSQLRWRVARAPEAAASGAFVGLRIETAASCQWLPEAR